VDIIPANITGYLRSMLYYQ